MYKMTIFIQLENTQINTSLSCLYVVTGRKACGIKEVYSGGFIYVYNILFGFVA